MRQPFILLTPMLKKLLPLLIVCCTLLAGCGASVPTIKPFKMDIQQGNVVTSKMLLQLKPGMTKSQVRFIMGTPLVVDSFHKDRWDYFYQMRQAGKIVEQRRVILDFEKELLIRVRGDVVPQGTLGAATGGDARESHDISAPITVEPRPKEPSLLDRLKFWKKDEKVSAKPDVVTAPAEMAAVAVPYVVASAEAKHEVKKPETAKPEIANTVADKPPQERSLLDKLKFWKKDEPATMTAKPAPESSKVELPVAETLAAFDAAPSVLAVPIELPSIEQPSAEQPNAEPTKEELPKDALVVTEPEAKTAPSITGKDSLKPFKSPSEKLLPAKPESLKAAPEKPATPSSSLNKAQVPKPALPDSQLSRPLKPLPINKDEKLIFRLDKNFDISRADEMKREPLLANDLPVEGMPNRDNHSKPQKADLEPLSSESEPSFFDKMLEKIGF